MVTGGPSGDAVDRESRDRARLERRKRLDVERRALHELPEAAAQDRPSFGRHANRHAGPRRPVHVLDDRITIQAQAELERHPRADAASGPARTPRTRCR